jgi:hypothetical protein
MSVLVIKTHPGVLCVRCCYPKNLLLLCAGKATHIIHEAPNVISCLNLAKARHPCESDPVLDDPIQLLIGITLHLLAGQIRRPWYIHRPAGV